MRAGEICSLSWDSVNFEKRTAFLPMTKNGTSRTVPLTKNAIAILERLKSEIGDYVLILSLMCLMQHSENSKNLPSENICISTIRGVRH